VSVLIILLRFIRLSLSVVRLTFFRSDGVTPPKLSGSKFSGPRGHEATRNSDELQELDKHQEHLMRRFSGTVGDMGEST
jgi:hypothetical protein